MKSGVSNKKRSFLYLLFARLFGIGKNKPVLNDKQIKLSPEPGDNYDENNLSILEEEQMQSPMRIVISNFCSNKVSMTGLCVFLLIFLFTIIGPVFSPLDLSFSETSQANVAPGLDLMKVPKSLNGKVKDISVGPTYSIAASNEGRLYIWGKTQVTHVIDLKYARPGMGSIKKVAAGFDHIVVLNDEGKVFAWGSDRQKQCDIPDEVSKLTNITDVAAGYQCTLVLTADGYCYFFGNNMNNDYNKFHPYQGKLAAIEVTSDAVMGMTFDGEAVYLGIMDTSYKNIPQNMGKIVDIAATASTMAALNDQGEVFVWGNVTVKGENRVPQTDSKIIKIEGGRYHYTALTESGQVVAWGADNYKQATVPESLSQTKAVDIFTGSYQNYAVTENGNIVTWGLKGYILGSDELGRDILNRIINGGKMTITIGAVAVVISTFIGVIIGSISGFFGGRLDLILQRIGEIVYALPFLPFAMILSALIGNKLESNQRVFLIMVILGLLSWPSLSRLVRAQVLSVREQEYVTAARALGVKRMAIVFKHVLPNVISVILVSATLDFATCMLTEAILSFLNFGVPAPQPTWGNMLYGAKNSIVIQTFWWRWVFPSIALGLCVICVNLIGDGMQEAIDPKSHQR
jgi:peptide/nickel transport system permease protein